MQLVVFVNFMFQFHKFINNLMLIDIKFKEVYLFLIMIKYISHVKFLNKIMKFEISLNYNINKLQ